jgi:hypothetical protein
VRDALESTKKSSFYMDIPNHTHMDKRVMRKILKAMMASFVYTKNWQEFQDFFQDETMMYTMTPATRNRLIEVLREFAGGDLMDPNYRYKFD